MGNPVLPGLVVIAVTANARQKGVFFKHSGFSPSHSLRRTTMANNGNRGFGQKPASKYNWPAPPPKNPVLTVNEVKDLIQRWYSAVGYDDFFTVRAHDNDFKNGTDSVYRFALEGKMVKISKIYAHPYPWKAVGIIHLPADKTFRQFVTELMGEVSDAWGNPGSRACVSYVNYTRKRIK